MNKDFWTFYILGFIASLLIIAAFRLLLAK